MRERQLDLQPKVAWNRPAAELRNQQPGIFQLLVFRKAISATFHVLGNCVHFNAGDSTIQVQREQGPCLCTSHCFTASTSVRSGEPARSFRAFPDAPPSSEPSCWTKASKRFLRASRPRMSRDFTVPSEI